MAIKILHILHAIKYSGAEVMLTLAAPYFQQNEVELHAVSTDDELGDYAEVFEKAGFTVHHIPLKLTPASLKGIYTFLKEENFAAVHIHTEQTFFWFALLARMASVKRTVYTIHNVFTYTGLVRIKRIIYRTVARRLFGLQCSSIGKSVEEVERTHLFNSTTLVPNWVDQNKFFPATDPLERQTARAKWGISENQTVLVSVGSCSVQKNHKDILNAINQIKEEVPGLLYLHIGDGVLHTEEQQYAESLGVSKQTVFLGQLLNVREVLIASDIFVMPSHYEGLPISLLEALSCGLPAVVYNNYGLRDLVDHTVNGFLTEAQPAALAEGIKKLAQNSSLRKRMGEEAQQKVLKEYNMHQSLRILMQLYGLKEKMPVIQPY
jgi:glycosyltransferase involved in cell wall biosynthesis